MRRQNKVSIRTIVLLVAIAEASSSPALLSAQASQQVEVRHAGLDYRPLSDQLLPGDKVVELHANYDDERALPNRPFSRAQLLATAVSYAEQVVVVQLETADARLFDQGRAIGTRLGCNVIEVIKPRQSSQLRAGSKVSFLHYGGEIEINGVLVRIRSRSEYKVGQKYLVFLKSVESPTADLTNSLSGSDSLLVEGDRLKKLPGSFDDLSGATLADVRRAVAKQR